MKNAWDVISDIVKKHGIVGLMLCYAMFNHYDNRNYERKNDKLQLETLNQIATRVEILDYKMESINSRTSRLENKFTVNVTPELRLGGVL